MGKWARRGGTTLSLFTALLLLRVVLEPREGKIPEVPESPVQRQKLLEASAASRLEQGALLQKLRRAEVLLVGEDHFYQETTQAFTGLLEARSLFGDERPLVLLLEIPSFLQPAVDSYVFEGRSAQFDAAVAVGKALPLGHILAWAHQRRNLLSSVRAIDENPARIFVRRALLSDTRNRGFAREVWRAREKYPLALVAVYGGQLHMLRAGRYRYDRADRTPLGALLLAQGLPPQALHTLFLSGPGKSPLADALPIGNYDLQGPLGEFNFVWVAEYPIFAVEQCRQLGDTFVQLGPLTRISRQH